MLAGILRPPRDSKTLLYFLIIASILNIIIALADPAAWIAACLPLMITYYRRINVIMKEKQINV